TTQNMRQVHTWEPLANPKIEMVHSARLDSDQRLILARLWIRDVLVAQNFRPTKLVNADGFHGSSNMRSKTHTPTVQTSRVGIQANVRVSTDSGAFPGIVS